jgi:hypothetical protein
LPIHDLAGYIGKWRNWKAKIEHMCHQ